MGLRVILCGPSLAWPQNKESGPPATAALVGPNVSVLGPCAQQQPGSNDRMAKLKLKLPRSGFPTVPHSEGHQNGSWIPGIQGLQNAILLKDEKVLRSECETKYIPYAPPEALLRALPLYQVSISVT